MCEKDIHQMPPKYCRDRSGTYPFQVFKLITCSMCYYYIFPSTPVFQQTADFKLSVANRNYSEAPDIENSTIMSRLCEAIGDVDKCKRWQACCLVAVDCCYRQEENENSSRTEVLSCPPTWDGFSCWQRSPANQRVSTKCPHYVHKFITHDSNAYKDCTANGTWWKNPTTNMEWTNYSTCIQIKKHRVIVFASVATNLISAMLLIPACFIFLYFRLLRMQHRIRLHVCLTVSFIFTAIFQILWTILVHHDQFLNAPEDTLLHKNTVGCRILYFMSSYFRSTNYFCMFVEGLYLCRLLSATFKIPKRLIGYYILCWGFPLVPNLIYAIVRGTLYNESRCWMNNTDGYEWILYTPNLLCLVGNVLFLIYILVVLFNQLQAHPNEPHDYRRTLKAIFIMIPLLGLQLLFIIYKPHTYFHELLSVIIVNSQGGLVAIMLCFFNSEVHNQIRSACKRLKSPVCQVERNYFTSTQLTLINNRPPSLRNGNTIELLNNKKLERCTKEITYIPIHKQKDQTCNDNCKNSSMFNT
ncbi:calcitonin gene-related peptide type 1 receptor-like isoform X1 [Octopus sinensis]|uniref:Calcitonin gene-related peptide type 1 receptor-like isoform X1 n=1 Tax=Octopus sinensis TaxID=2607531 RepID=A0A7E6ET20_9MOLL|nr:calcitonin gene-related peptide type 1 receptor-like isoform X1 [Octopus sinensis]